MINQITKSENETQLLGMKISKKIKSGDVLALIGDLASGKTTFVKGILKGLGYSYNVTSPTFTLINNYEAKYNVMHADFYREPNKKRWVNLGFNELIDNSEVVLIEWHVVYYILVFLYIRKYKLTKRLKNNYYYWR